MTIYARKFLADQINPWLCVAGLTANLQMSPNQESFEDDHVHRDVACPKPVMALSGQKKMADIIHMISNMMRRTCPQLHLGLLFQI